MCRQDGSRPGSGNEDDVTVIKTMDLVISLGKEVRERYKSVMIPGFVAGEDWCLVVPFTRTGNTDSRPGLGARVRRDDEICQLWQVQSECRGNSIQVELPSKKTHIFPDGNMMLTCLALYLLVLNKCWHLIVFIIFAF